MFAQACQTLNSIQIDGKEVLKVQNKKKITKGKAETNAEREKLKNIKVESKTGIKEI